MIKRDILRFLFRGRYIIAAAGILGAVLAGFLYFNLPSSEPQNLSQLPATDGEYITVVEELDAYCRKLGKKAENIRKYQLSSAMGEILNNRVAKDADGVKSRYAAMAEKYRSESRRLENGAWQAYNNAVNGPESSYAETMKKYTEQGIKAGAYLSDAEYCENIVRLMSMNGPVDSEAERRTVEYINSAAAELKVLTAAPAKQPPLPFEASVLAGLLGGMLLVSAAIAAMGGISLCLRLKKQSRQIRSAKNGALMEQINFRG